MIDRGLRSVALLVAACFFMQNLDGTIGVTAIPQMSASLDATPGATALVITTYLLTLAIRLGVAAATVALRIRTEIADLLPGRAGASTAYTFAFALLGLIALGSTIDALRLHPSAGEALVQAPAR